MDIRNTQKSEIMTDNIAHIGMLSESEYQSIVDARAAEDKRISDAMGLVSGRKLGENAQVSAFVDTIEYGDLAWTDLEYPREIFYFTERGVRSIWVDISYDPDDQVEF